MTVKTGLGFYVEYDGVSIWSDSRNFKPNLEYETVEGSAGGDTLRNYVPTLLKCDPELTLIVDDNAAGQAIRAVLKEGNDGNLIWGFEGNVVGKPKWGITANISKAQVDDVTYDGELEIKVKFYSTAGTLLFDGRTATF
jgi:hypothetical protein